MKLDDYDRSDPCIATVLASHRITEEESEAEVREIVLEMGRDIACAPGHSIGVLVPGPHPQGHDTHFRLYSIADVPSRSPVGRPEVRIAVRRMTYVDEYSGERFKGIASNYLCDRLPGDAITVAGPYGYAFEIPEDRRSDLILIGAGTGIAPFRAFIRHLYAEVPDWSGRVRLFYGAHTGLELFYMNDVRDDFALYYDYDTFKAFKAVSPRPHWAEPIAWDYCLEERSTEILDMLENVRTRVYLAGLEEARDHLDAVFAGLLGSEREWQRRRAELVAGGRWQELLY